MSSETEDHQKQCLATLKRLKRGDENESERKPRLRRWSLANTSRLAVETGEERRARLENDTIYVVLIFVYDKGGVLVVCEEKVAKNYNNLVKGLSMRQKLQNSKGYAESPKFLPALGLFSFKKKSRYN